MWENVLRTTLLTLELFTCTMAIYGGVSMLADAAGFGLSEAWLRGSPFTNYQIPAIGLLVGVAGTSLFAAASLLGICRPWNATPSLIAGTILIIFEVVETYSIGLRNFQQPLMLAFGLAMFGLAAIYRKNGSSVQR